MQITLKPDTSKLLQEQMNKGHCDDADAVVRLALETLGQVEDDTIEELDAPTQESILRAEEQSARGDGRPWEQVKEELRAHMRLD